MPYLLSQIVPAGMMGLLVAAMLAADMSTDSSYMLTWGSVIYNDILAPFRRGKPMSEKRGLLWNRFIVAMIGVQMIPGATREDTPRLVAEAVAAGRRVYGVRVLTSTLEETYLEAVGGETD